MPPFSTRSLGGIPREIPCSAAFASNFDDLVRESRAPLWIHGHIHTSFDYRIGSTRVVCNPRGYPREARTGVRPDFTVEV